MLCRPELTNRFQFLIKNMGNIKVSYFLISVIMRCAVCDVRCVMCGIRCALCVIRCASCAVRCALCVVRCALYIIIYLISIPHY